MGASTEAETLRLDRRIVIVWRVQRIALAVATAAAVTVVAANRQLPYVLVFGVVASVGVIVAWISAAIEYRHWTYAVQDAGIELRRGVVMRRQQLIPFFRVQHVDVSQGPVDRWMGLRELVIHTASAATDAKLPGLTDADAAALRELLLARAGVDDGV